MTRSTTATGVDAAAGGGRRGPARAAGRARARSSSIAESYRACRAITRKNAKHFYLGLRLSPEPARSALYAVYAWMRLLDDIGDGGGAAGEKVRRIERFAARTDGLFDDPASERGFSTWAALADTVARFGLRRRDFREAIEGVLEDACAEPSHTPRYATTAELETYCDRVAATVGLICIRLWGLAPDADQDHADALAVQRGRAFQLTNILRDIVEDFDTGRVYLPASAFERHGVNARTLATGGRTEAAGRLVAEFAAKARSMYDASARLDEMIDRRGAASLRVMTAIYASLLGEIERDPCAVLERRVRLPGHRKACIALRAALAPRATAET